MKKDLNLFLVLFLLFLGIFIPIKVVAQICTRTNFGTTNLVNNGDFESGNDGSFSSDYSYVSPPAGSLGGGQYTIDNAAQPWNTTYFRTPVNHSGGGDLPSGSFYLADGGNNASDDVYRTDVTVVAGNTYIFSAWVANIHTTFDNPPEMEFYVGTDNIGSLLTSSSSNDWGQFYAFWQAPSSGIFTIALRNAVTGTGGNDLAIDNVFFTRDCDNLVNFEIQTDLPDSVFACGVTNQDFETGLSATNYDFEWKEAGALGTPLGSTTSYSTSVPGTFYVCVDPKGLGCPVPDTVVYIQATTPNVAGGTLNCGTKVAGFTASVGSGPSDFKWFDELTDGTEIGTGANFTTPLVSCGAPTYYLENSAIKIPSGATAGADFSDGGNSNQYTAQNFHHLEFDAKKTFILESVQVRYNKKNYGACSGTVGNSFGIQLRDNTNTEVYKNVPDVPCGSGYEVVTIPLGWEIDAGTDYQMRLTGDGTGTEVTYLSNGADYSVGGPLDNAVVHITGNVSTNGGDAAKYGAFFNWVLTIEDACPRIPAVVTSSCGSAEICNNGIDDDCDGLIDCYDPDCLGTCGDFYYGAPTPVCQEIPSVDPNFGLDTVWTSVEAIETRSAGVVGDMDGDGIPEVVAHKWYSGPARRSLVILDGQTGETEVDIDNGSIFIDEFNSIAAIADVDNDGTGEIFQVFDDRKIYRFEHDGTLAWSSNAIFSGLTADNPQRWVVNIADFNGDGVPELYTGNEVYNSLTGILIAAGGTGNSHGIHGPHHAITVAADVLPDGFCADCQGLELIAGNMVYSVNVGTGTMTVESSSSEQDGMTSIADWNCDGELDVLVSRNGGQLYVWDPRLTTASKFITTTCDGSPMGAMPVNMSTGGPGPINVGDFDGDGEPELGLAGTNIYVALENDFTTMWTKTAVDVSNITASSTFDFEGDGLYEVVYRDEQKLYILDGVTGNEKSSIDCISGTRMELPVVADVNGDGEANILVTCAGFKFPGANKGQSVLFTSNTNTWVKTRKVWNQHSYNPVAINEDLTVPAVQQNHAIVPKHNVFLANSPFIDINGDLIFKPVPDLQGTVESVDVSGGCTGTTTASFTAFNTGDLSFPTDLEVAIYQGDPASGGSLIGTTTLDNNNSSAVDAFTRSFDYTVPAAAYDLYLVVNDDGTDAANAPTEPLTECVNTNNVSSLTVSCPVTCNKPTSVTISPTPVTGCENASIDLSGSYVDGGVTPTTGMNYVWYKQGSPPSAGDYASTSGTITDHNFASAATGDAGTYVLRVEDGTAGDVSCYTESTVVLTVNQAAAITTQPTLADADLCPTENFTLSVVAAGTNLNYQWKRGTTNVGTNSPSLTISGVTSTDAGTYTVEITGDCGSVTSSGVAITVGNATAITTQPTLTNTDLCPTDGLALSVTATGDNLSYQWKRGTTNVGIDSPNLNIASVTPIDAGNYTVEITGDCGDVTSTGVAITVGTTTVITTQPSLTDTDLCPNDALALSVVAAGDNLSYQWKRGTTNVGTDSPNLNIASVSSTDAGTYTVEITGDCGNVTSTGVAITVGTTTVITTQPSLANTDLCPTDALALSVGATGDNLSYQWKRDATNVGTDSPNLNIASVSSTDAGTYTVEITGDCGDVTSTGVAITVGTTTVITTQPSLTDTDLCPNDALALSVVAAGDNLSYQWKRGTTNVGTDSPNLNIASVSSTDAGTYTVEITGDCGNVTSTGVAITVGTTTVITTQPSLANTDLCPTDALALSVVAAGDNLSYQWKRNATNVGTDSPNLNIASSVTTDAGIYTVEITGDCGAPTSTGVSITIGTTTAITTQPSLTDTDLCPGEDFTLNVVADGDNLTYEWFRDATSVGTGTALPITNVTSTDAGSYTVVATGDCGTATSTAVVITIGTTTVIDTDPTAVSTCANSDIAFSVSASGDNLSYQWQKNGGDITSETASIYSLMNVKVVDQGDFTVIVTGDCGVETSAIAALTITATEVPAVTIATIDPICEGGDATIEVTTSNGGGSAPTYTYFQDGSPIAAATGVSTTTHTITGLTANANVSVEMNSNSTCIDGSATNPIGSNVETIQVDASPDASVPGTAESICTDQYTLSGNTPIDGNGIWTADNVAVSFDDASLPGAQASGIPLATTVNFTWTISNGVCTDESNSVAITRLGNLTSPDAGTNQTICEGGVANLIGNTPATGETGTWTAATGLVQAGDNATVSGLIAGTTAYTYTMSNGTCPDASATVDVQVDAAPDVSIPGTADNICTEEYTLSGNTPVNGSGLWTADNIAVTFDDATLPGAKALGIPLASTVTFTWTISNGVCTSESNTVAISRLGDLTSPNAGSYQVICEGDVANLTGNTPATGETGTWTAATGLVQAGDNATVSGLTAGTTTYTYTMSNGTCPDAFATVDVKVFGPTTSGIITPITVGTDAAGTMTQRNAPVVITSAAPGAEHVGVWAISGAGTGTETSPTTYEVTDLGAFEATTTVTWTVTDTANACPAAVSTLEITRKDFTVAAANDDSSCVTDLNGFVVSGNAFSSPDETGSWISLDGLTITDNGDNATITQIPTITGESQVFRFEYTVYNTPLDTTTIDTAAVIVYATPSIPDAGLNDTICLASVNLNATAPTIGEGVWNVVYGTGTVQTSTLVTSLLEDLNDGDTVRVEWAVTNNMCATARDTVQVIRAGTVTTPIAGNDDVQCETTTAFTLNANVVGVGEIGTWSSTDLSITFDNVNAENTIVNNLQRGENKLIWTIDNGFCSPVTDTVTVSLDSLPTVAALATDRSVCAEPVTITGNTPTIGIASWNVLSGGSSLALITGDSTEINTLGGTNEIEYTISNGTCPSSSDQIIITKVGELSSANAGLNDSLCSSILSYTLQANTPDVSNNETGSWFVQSGSAVINDLTNPTSTVNSLSLGLNELAWVISNGVCPNDTGYVSLIVSPEQSVADAGNDTTICGTTGVLSGITPVIGTGEWIYNAAEIAIDDKDNAQSDYTIAATSASITWRVSSPSCTDKDATIIISSTSKADPSVSLTSSHTLACTGIDSVTFTASPILGGTAPSYKWYINNTLQPLANSSVFKKVLTANSSVIIEMTSDLACVNTTTDRDTIDVATEDLQVINLLETDQTVCDQFMLTLQGYQSGTIAWYENGLQIPLENELMLNLTKSASYNATVKGAQCPEVTTPNVTITVDYTPVVNAGDYQQVFEGQATNLEGEVDTARLVEWTPSTFLDNPNLLQPLLEATDIDGGFYTYTLTAANGNCIDSDSVQLLIRTPLKIPNAFSPNGDGINDRWIIGGMESYPDAHIMIFNRWGAKLYERFGGYPVDDAWDGKGFPVGTYYYILDLNNTGGNDEETARGAVTITK